MEGVSTRLLNGSSTLEEEVSMATELKKFVQLENLAGNVFKMFEDYQVSMEASNMYKLEVIIGNNYWYSC
jgi:hypothetical protein